MGDNGFTSNGSDAVAPSLRSFQCPQCAGSLAPGATPTMVVCPHCGVSLAVRTGDDHSGYARAYFPCRVSREAAVEKAYQWLAHHPGLSSRTRREARFTEARLFYVPIWEFAAVLAGWEFGHRTRTRLEVRQDDEQPRLLPVDESVEEPVLAARRFYRAAVDLAALGLSRPHIAGRDRALPLLPGELETGALVMAAEGGSAEVVAQGRKSFLQPFTDAMSPEDHLSLLDERVTLLYYPVWMLRYRAAGRLYAVAVDGKTGEIQSARGPASLLTPLWLVVAKLTLLAVGLALIVSACEAGGQSRSFIALAAVVVAGLAVFMLRGFTLPREVEYHEPFSA